MNVEKDRRGCAPEVGDERRPAYRSGSSRPVADDGGSPGSARNDVGDHRSPWRKVQGMKLDAKAVVAALVAGLLLVLGAVPATAQTPSPSPTDCYPIPEDGCDDGTDDGIGADDDGTDDGIGADDDGTEVGADDSENPDDGTDNGTDGTDNGTDDGTDGVGADGGGSGNGGALARTGGVVGTLVLAGLATILVGIVVLAAPRRRRATS